MLHGPESTQRRARDNRRKLSLPEGLLWQVLKQRPAGLRFRKQHPAGIYVLDFFCPRHRLAVEIDGESHSMGDRPLRDAERDRWIGAQEVKVLRISARDVLHDLDAVVRHIVATAVPAANYPSTAFGGPPPPPGEEFSR